MNNLWYYREKARLTQAQLAKELGISRQFYCLCENGKAKMSPNALMRCANILNVSIDDLLEKNVSDISEKIIEQLPSELIDELKRSKMENIIKAWQYLKYLNSKDN